MSKTFRETLPRLLLLTIIALSLGVLLYGLKVWNSYNQRRSLELQHQEMAEKLAESEAVVRDLRAQRRDRDVLGPRVINGVVEAVNLADQLVVLSVGKEQLVQRGFEFAVRRGGEIMGTVQVIEVYDDLSGARITFLKSPNEIRVGDTVSMSSL